MMAATVIDKLNINVNELDKINSSKEKWGNDVKKAALNFVKNSLEISVEEVNFVANSLNTNSKPSLFSRIFRASAPSKEQHNNDKEKIEHADLNINTNVKSSLRQKIQEFASNPRSYTRDSGYDRS